MVYTYLENLLGQSLLGFQNNPLSMSFPFLAASFRAALARSSSKRISTKRIITSFICCTNTVEPAYLDNLGSTLWTPCSRPLKDTVYKHQLHVHVRDLKYYAKRTIVYLNIQNYNHAITCRQSTRRKFL